MAVDANGSVYCSGYTDSFKAGRCDLALVKFAPDGTRLWNVTWGGANDDYGYGVAVDANGSVYCTGYTVSFAVAITDLALVKFAPNGTRLWNVTWGQANAEAGYNVAVGARGAVYCTGVIGYLMTGKYDLALVKFGFKPPESPVLASITPDPDADGIIELNWSAVIDAEKYYIYREVSTISIITSVWGLTPKYVVTETTFTDTLAINGTYHYVIVAENTYANSSISNCESVVVGIPLENGGVPGFFLGYLVIGLLALGYLVIGLHALLHKRKGQKIE
ncbi:MAG TPA: SBBP repeat-containing protein [Candidatus Deferrimicrobium sp.]|nr:SBBP repeat-containing protein [Candidatus Deferrimicrobium sp.]